MEFTDCTDQSLGFQSPPVLQSANDAGCHINPQYELATICKVSISTGLNADNNQSNARIHPARDRGYLGKS